MKKTQQKRQAFDKPLKRKENKLIPIQDVDPEEQRAWVALICKKLTHPAEFERERDLMYEKAIALLAEEIIALESNTEPATAKGTINQTMLGKMAIRLCHGDLKAAKFYLETGKMPKKKKG